MRVPDGRAAKSLSLSNFVRRSASSFDSVALPQGRQLTKRYMYAFEFDTARIRVQGSRILAQIPQS